MSRSWRERLFVSVEPERVGAVALARGWNGKLKLRHTADRPVDAGPSRTLSIVATVREIFGTLASRGATCSIVVADSFARYAVLPWRDDLRDSAARAAFAGLHLNKVYGAAADAWEFVLDERGYGEPALVCAMDRDLVEMLHVAARECRVRLASVRPCLAAALNRWRHRIQEPHAFFAVVEPNHVCLAAIANDEITALRSERVRGSAAATLDNMARQHMLASAQSPQSPSIYAFGPDMAADLEGGTALTTYLLQPDAYLAPVGGDKRFAMALV